MVLVGILVMGQIADGLSYTLAKNGVELNPFMAALGASALTVKFGALAVLAIIAWRLRHRPRTLLWLSAVGWLGALTNFTGHA